MTEKRLWSFPYGFLVNPSEIRVKDFVLLSSEIIVLEDFCLCFHENTKRNYCLCNSVTGLLVEMAKFYLWVLLIIYLFSTVLIHQAFALTDPSDVEFRDYMWSRKPTFVQGNGVQNLGNDDHSSNGSSDQSADRKIIVRTTAVTVLQDLYKALNKPQQLVGWNLSGGDPCEESWKGISCSGSSVIFITLNGLELSGNLGGNLFHLFNLKQLDVSSNHIHGEIPYSLPPNATHIDLSSNNFSQNIPFSLTSMKYLRHLNISHNSLSGPVGDIFMGLRNLKKMDLSYNNFTGDLPRSFESLTNLTGLFLQNNQFTGSVIYLAYLPLTDLNIQNNHFSGVVPKQFEYIPNLWIGGNSFQIGGDYPPWNFPTDTIPNDKNIGSHPKTQSNAIESYPTLRSRKQKQKRFSPAAIAFMVGGVALVATCAAAIIALQIKQSRLRKLENLERDHSGFHTPLSIIDCSFSESEGTPQSLMVASPPVPRPRHVPSVHYGRTEDFNGRRQSRNPPIAKMYTVSELQSATNSFSKDNLLGEGSLGSVYKAKFPDGQIFAARSIKTEALSLHEEERFFNVIQNVASLRHPNIISLIGYCIENGQYLLVYEYVRNWSLENALHNNDQKHLPWNNRMTIALGISRALHYLHSTSSPTIAHNNLKAANILLDDEFMPRLCDSGLAVLRPFTSNTTKLKASELAISCSGYTAPENGQGRVDNRKSDIFSFGVLLLELLTGRKPFDSTRPREEQSLVK
ncbi:Protein kinase domain [Macleaya cordata]|uniref:Protein kinase domain n=1 Tax=Macleaya cordata TaxID=56857 RepID=A0A200Q883_MACCD|nr:Protein kinase domain [Macleaya cordata]